MKRADLEKQLLETTLITDGLLFYHSDDPDEQHAEWQTVVAKSFARRAAEIMAESSAPQPVVVCLSVGAPTLPLPAPAIRVDIAEMARQLSKSERTVRRLVAKRRIPFENSGREVIVKHGRRKGMKVTVGGELSFDPAAVRRALDRQQIKAIGD